MNQIKTWEELELKDDFMFAKVMRNKTICKKMLEKILNIRIRDIEFPEEQKTIDMTVDGKSIRLDVYVEDDIHTVYDVEMQVANKGDLRKRSRYYQGMIDLQLIEKGESYNKLKKSYVIFICTFDLFGQGRHIYTFENVCLQDENIRLNDEATKVFLSSKGTMEDVDEDVKAFLKYLNGELVKNDFVETIDLEVAKVRDNKEWRREFMTLFMRENEIREESRAEGKIEGKIEGKAELVSIIRKKIGKGLRADAVADMLELEPSYVERVIGFMESDCSKNDHQIAEALVAEEIKLN